MPSEEDVRTGFELMVEWAKENIDKEITDIKIEKNSHGTFTILTSAKRSYVFAMIVSTREEQAKYIGALLHSTYTKALNGSQ